LKKLNKILDSIFEVEKSGLYAPKATPLCHWCDYSITNPNAPFYSQDLCNYYSLWTPDNKTFKVNRKFEESDELEF